MSQAQQKNKNFAQKLTDILKNPGFSSIIVKKPNSPLIQILDQQALIHQVLPYYFNHNRLESFFRQLNMYGFKKLRCKKCHTFYHSKIRKETKASILLAYKKDFKLSKEMKIQQKNKQRMKKRQQNKQNKIEQEDDRLLQIKLQQKQQQKQKQINEVRIDSIQNQNEKYQWNNLNYNISEVYYLGNFPLRFYPTTYWFSFDNTFS